jgi:hypothetical protein
VIGCPRDTNGDGDCAYCARHPERCPLYEVSTPFEVGTTVDLYGCPGTIRKRQQDSVSPVHWRYEVEWATGTSGWWGHAKVAEMSPQAPQSEGAVP